MSADTAVTSPARVPLDPAAGVPFPSAAWFERLIALMREQRALHERLGYIDCTVRFRVRDGGPGGAPFEVDVRFEEFSAVELRLVTAALGAPDFALDATLETWRRMIESIAAGSGRPGLDQTLNHLSLRGDALRVVAADPLGRDMFFRFNQSLQAFVNASRGFTTCFEAQA